MGGRGSQGWVGADGRRLILQVQHDAHDTGLVLAHSHAADERVVGANLAQQFTQPRAQFQIVNVDGMEMAGAMRDTVLVPPMSSVTFAFDAGNPGKGWAFHCHHLYHMATGMMTFVPYV